MWRTGVARSSKIEGRSGSDCARMPACRTVKARVLVRSVTLAGQRREIIISSVYKLRAYLFEAPRAQRNELADNSDIEPVYTQTSGRCTCHTYSLPLSAGSTDRFIRQINNQQLMIVAQNVQHILLILRPFYIISYLIKLFSFWNFRVIYRNTLTSVSAINNVL